MPIPSQVANVRWNLNPPPAVGPHAYFDQWAISPQCVHAYSLRDDAQLTALAKNYNHNLTSAAPGWVYDTTRDAAQGTVLTHDPIDADILPQLWIVDPTTTDTLTFVWDLLIPAMWSTIPAQRGLAKAFQTTKAQGSSLGVFMETRIFTRANQLPVIGCVDWRSYGTLGPGAFRGSTGVVGCRNSDCVQPLLLSHFMLHADTWTRFVEHIELNAMIDSGVTYDLWSLWVGDEDREMVQLYDQIPQAHIATGIKGFAFEYDASLTLPVGTPPPSVYNRNFLMFRGLLEPELLLTKPVA